MARRRKSVKLGKPVWALIALFVFVLLLAGGLWLYRHPEHNPFAPIDLDQPIGWATRGKLASLASDPARCYALLEHEGVRYERLRTVGQGKCYTNPRTRVFPNATNWAPFTPAGIAPSCAVSTSLILWQRDVVQPAAMRHLGHRVVSIEHLGSYNCRNIAGSVFISQHATGNAIDIAAFILDDGRRVSLLDDWDARDGRSAFLRAVRDGSCRIFTTVLSPDYNKAHANHFHFDQQQRPLNWSVCR